MTAFPQAPVPPAEFMASYLGDALAGAAELREQVQALDTRLGVRLEGQGGGEWVVRLARGEIEVRDEPRAEAAFTLIQSVEDWRGSLWEGQGGAIGRQTAAFFRPGADTLSPAGGLGGAPTPAALARMESLDGLMRMVVAGGEGGDWSVGFKLGPGEIPAEATTTVTLSAEDAVAMQTGELDPMQAFMAGRVQVEGDLSLLLQIQAIQMQVQAEGG